MSLSDAKPQRRRSVTLCAALAAGLALGGCTVRPLYGTNTVDSAGASVRAELGSIAIKPVSSRYAQEVRNQLIFLFNGGKGQPASAAYSMALRVAARHESGVVVQTGLGADGRVRGAENEPTAGFLTMSANYTVTDNAKGNIAADGKRQVTSSYDIPRQEFAAVRAKRDAEDRAARELAQLISLAVAQELSTR